MFKWINGLLQVKGPFCLKGGSGGIMDSILGNVEDDDFTDDDEEPPGEEEEEDDESLEGDEFEEEEDEEDDDDDEEPPAERLFTQEEVNQIVGGARIKGREVEADVMALESITGKSIKELVPLLREQQIRTMAEEQGITEDEARQQFEREERTLTREVEASNMVRQAQLLKYTNDKNAALNNPRTHPFVKKYEKEIDMLAAANISESGQILSFDTALTHILGEKVKSGELIKSVQKGAEKKTMAGINKRNKASIESGPQGGSSKSVALNRFEREFAAGLGLSEKDVAAEKKRVLAEKKRKNSSGR